MKILYVTTIGTTMIFFKHLIKQLVNEKNSIDIACNEAENPVPEEYRELKCKIFSLPFLRSPLKIGNIRAVFEIRKLVKENGYDVVHCHTPIAAACTRLACRRFRARGLKVLYTAHGFHFYKGAPLKNWLIYFPIEWLCAFFTDVLITINTEDYAFAKKHLHAKKIEYVPGVGVDLDRFKNISIDKNAKREELGFPKDAFLLLSVGELNENKNHEVIIKALALLKDQTVHYAIAGKGKAEDRLRKLSVDLQVEKQVHLLGFRDDIHELNYIADVFCFPSKREGLGLAALEAMASGLPIITSNVHGINDYSIDGITGCKCSPYDVEAFKDAICVLRTDEDKRKKICTNNRKHVEKYNISHAIVNMKTIYNGIFADKDE